MNICDSIDFYCLNFHEERREKMIQKGNHFQIPLVFYSGVPSTDNRITFVENPGVRRTASICYGHLDMIHHFFTQSEKEFAIIMEDDILIKDTFVEDMRKSVDVMRTEKIDLLLIGYLCHNPIHTYSNFPEIYTPYSRHEFRIMGYPDNSWGTQMYMIARKQCKYLLDKYAHGYLEKSIENPDMTPFSADWTITKEGKRALLYPLRVIENGSTIYDDKGQENCRILCAEFTKRDGFI